ncbi:hypothetical protein [Paenibacillus sp. FSL H7-0331]|uniref:hypothetical protein n=1 Tax=Paenibacillus sp. FSL H7-0331 TaxID=1920421 RepID=UPI00096C4D43|nr:hypothetical protein [Paenibacillus sp. FSL H7-0331]OMF00482.1 hypothetical protein BK127_38470 [Paenibacillus sp. FSL H7-0331]
MTPKVDCRAFDDPFIAADFLKTTKIYMRSVIAIIRIDNGQVAMPELVLYADVVFASETNLTVSQRIAKGAFPILWQFHKTAIFNTSILFGALCTNMCHLSNENCVSTNTDWTSGSGNMLAAAAAQPFRAEGSAHWRWCGRLRLVKY